MENQHSHHHTCTHCACSNPILKILKEDIFRQENFNALPTTKKEAHGQPLNLMVSGGTIRPMINGSVATVPAIGMANGQVVITGTEDVVKTFMDNNYPGYTGRILDPGQTLLPGLIEPHVHIVPTALLMGWMDLSPFTAQVLNPKYSIDSVTEIVQNKKVIKGNWLLGYGLDPALMPFASKSELVTINLEVLNKISALVPLMVLSASMHTLYLNTPALTLVYNKNKAKLNELGYGSLEDYLSKTDGQLQEEAGMGPALNTLPKVQIYAMVLESFQHFEQLFKEANQRGVTFLYDAGMSKNLKLLLDAYLLLHPRVVRIGAAQMCGSTQEALDLTTYTAPEVYKDIYYGNIKVVSDGSNQGLTGYQSEPYLCNPVDNVGIFNFQDPPIPPRQEIPGPPQVYQDLLHTIIATKGWPLMVHANGNLAVQFAIEVFQSLPKDKVIGKRHRIEHCSLTTDDQLNTMKDLEISPSFLIGHVGYWGHAFQQVIFGKEKTDLLDRCNSALKQGMRITLHSDNQVSPLGPLRMMEQSITRKMEADRPEHKVLNADERITAEQALVAATYDAAWQCYADKWVGSLETGKFADFVILDQDPITLKDPYMKMRNINVLETWVDGHKVYS
ncbi:amidohydrolase [Pedobacter gandavensis]|uniref:amidohydrolase n=1 Tax=Pedobacter gandavensis TaxID=2679963 RepID=UPI0029318160|nr:amidohydrolase [Pedobacter gandavensis]